MKSFLKKIFYKNVYITEYSGITISNDITEKVYLKTGSALIDITEDQWVLSLEPLVFGIWLDKQKPLPGENESYVLVFEEHQKNHKPKKTAVAKLAYSEKIEEPEGTLLLLKLESSRISHTSLLESLFIFSRYYRKPGFTFKKLKAYASAYSYPRKVRIVSFLEPGYFNIFPMDLLGKINGTNRFVFGLRHTNQALGRIIETKKLVVTEVPFIYKKEIYELGKHHSAAPPSLEELRFKTTPSRHFGFPVTEWADSYNEIQISRTINLGSHMLLWGESQHEEMIKPASMHFYHIHFLLYLYQKRLGQNYHLA
jgi:hypothetical protein